MKKFSIFNFQFLIFFALTAFFWASFLQPARAEQDNNTITTPQLQIQIPGFKGFTKDVQICLTEGKSLAECQKGQRGYSIPWIGEYIIAIYKWSVGAIAVLAVIMIMWGGMQWLLAAGNATQISAAKNRITQAVIGLILIVGSNIFLGAISPNLTIIPPIKIGIIERVELNGELSDNGVADQSSSGIYFKQCDSRWGSMAYTDANKSKCNLCSSGCGASAVAIVLASKGVAVTPQDIGQYAIDIGARKDCSGGTNVSFLAPKAAEKWGLKEETIADFDKAMQYLDNGSWLIVSIRKLPVGGTSDSGCGQGIAFCGGHYIVLAGKSGDVVNVIDSSRRNIISINKDILKKYLSRIEFYNIWK